MRNMADSGNTAKSERLSACADARSRPNGFSAIDASAPRASGAAELRRRRSRTGSWEWRDSAAGRCARAQLATQAIERRRIFVVAVHVAEQRQELVEGRPVDAAAVRLQAVSARASQLIEVPAGLCHADDGHVQMAALHHRLQRREDLLVREVAGRAEEHQRIGVRWGLDQLFFLVSAELVSHRREQLVGEVLCAARGEALRQRGAQDRRGDALVDGRLEGPAPLARVGHATCEPDEVGALLQRCGGEVEEPRTDDAAVPPCFGDVGEVQLVPVELGVPERRGLGVGRPLRSSQRWRGEEC